MSQRRNPAAQVTYQTPDEVLERVRKVDEIGLDPATSIHNPTGARAYFTEADDGLARDWSGHSLVYCNPPFERRWYRKMGEQAALGIEMIGLVMATPTTSYFQEDLLPHARAACFWKGRLTFKGQPQCAGFGVAFVYYGRRVERFREAFHDRGWIVPGGAR